MASSTRPSSMETVEETSDALLLSKEDVLRKLESIVMKFLEAICNGSDPELSLVNRSGSNRVRSRDGCVHLGKTKTTKKLFSHRGVGAQKFAKIWQILSLCQRLVQEDKIITQREGYYSLVQHFKNQAEFNDTLQDVVALTGCARVALGICASSNGAVAGLLQWKDQDGEWEDCTTPVAGKKIPGVLDGVQFRSMGARYILVVEKDAVFTYLCGQQIWSSLPCIIVTGCGYPPLTVRALVKTVSQQFSLPVIGLFDYNPHGLRILLTYKYGSIRMGTEAHAYSVDIQWLGVHHSDLYYEDGRMRVSEQALQQWSPSDSSVYKGLKNTITYMNNPRYTRELEMMEASGVKVEIEALNNNGFDSLEGKIIQKILCRQYF